MLTKGGNLYRNLIEFSQEKQIKPLYLTRRL